MNEEQNFEEMLERIGGLIKSCNENVERLRRCEVCLDFYRKNGQPENAGLSEEDLLKGRDALLKQREEYKKVFQNIRDGGAKCNVLETLLLTGFEWTSENKEPNLFLNIGLDLAYHNERTFEQSYANAVRILDNIGMNDQARIVESYVTRFNGAYKPIRDGIRFEGSEDEKLDRLAYLKIVCDNADKKHNEINYYADAFYRDDKKEKRKAIEFFINLGAKTDWCENKIVAFALERLNKARLLRDTTLLATQDSIYDAIKEGVLTGRLEKAASYFTELDLIEDRLSFYSRRWNKVKEDRNGVEEFEEAMREEFPLQPYQDMILSKI